MKGMRISFYLGLAAGVIVFLLGYAVLRTGNTARGIAMLALSIVIFVSTGTMRISITLSEMKSDNIQTDPSDSHNAASRHSSKREWKNPEELRG